MPKKNHLTVDLCKGMLKEECTFVCSSCCSSHLRLIGQHLTHLEAKPTDFAHQIMRNDGQSRFAHGVTTSPPLRIRHCLSFFSGNSEKKGKLWKWKEVIFLAFDYRKSL